ncbi:uncharacterized protein LOC144133908 [Amblyomma americanum]
MTLLESPTLPRKVTLSLKVMVLGATTDHSNHTEAVIRTVAMGFKVEVKVMILLLGRDNLNHSRPTTESTYLIMLWRIASPLHQNQHRRMLRTVAEARVTVRHQSSSSQSQDINDGPSTIPMCSHVSLTNARARLRRRIRGVRFSFIDECRCQNTLTELRWSSDLLETVNYAGRAAPVAFREGQLAPSPRISRDLTPHRFPVRIGSLWESLLQSRSPHFSSATSKRPAGAIHTTIFSQASDIWARDGGHVALSICSEEEILAASRWNLLPGDNCGLLHRPSYILKCHPLRLQHRRMLRTVAEAGLAVRHRKPPSPPTRDISQDVSPIPLFFAVYIVGCAMALISLFLELLWKKCDKNTEEAKISS